MGEACGFDGLIFQVCYCLPSNPLPQRSMHASPPFGTHRPRDHVPVYERQPKVRFCQDEDAALPIPGQGRVGAHAKAGAKRRREGSIDASVKTDFEGMRKTKSVGAFNNTHLAGARNLEVEE